MRSMASTPSWWEYVQHHAGRDTPYKDIAAAVSIHPSRITGWAKGEPPSAESAVAFARAYLRPPVEALIAADYLDVGEVDGVVQLAPPLRDLKSEDLAAELLRRTRDDGLDANPDAPPV